ncbi:MAG: ABC transporter permease [Candidatus Omnitrophica bacterium]|nr:ABC transporter permease [Candidatus Omnitrophota bacterium]
MNPLINFLKRVAAYRAVIGLMALRTIQYRYAGTLAGMAWSFLQPLMMILVYWLVFSVGFKLQPAQNIPFIVMFLCGLIPWAMFHETLTANVQAITGNPHLVKKTVFPTEILPVVNLAASFISHGIMLVILAVILIWNRIPFSWHNLQFLYYLLALSIFSLGLSWFLSALNVFYRDTSQILSVLLNLWFWLTPVVWMSDLLPAHLRPFIQLNPIYYIIEGYRSSFIYHEPFWHHGGLGLYFWGVSSLALIAGGMIFRRLKPEFADEL